MVKVSHALSLRFTVGINCTNQKKKRLNEIIEIKIIEI